MAAYTLWPPRRVSAPSLAALGLLDARNSEDLVLGLQDKPDHIALLEALEQFDPVDLKAMPHGSRHETRNRAMGHEQHPLFLVNPQHLALSLVLVLAMQISSSQRQTRENDNR